MWLEQGERGRKEGRDGTGAGHAGQIWGLLSQGEAGAGGLGRRGWGLTRGLTGALVADMGRTDCCKDGKEREERQLPWSKVPMMELGQRIDGEVDALWVDCGYRAKAVLVDGLGWGVWKEELEDDARVSELGTWMVGAAMS